MLAGELGPLPVPVLWRVLEPVPVQTEVQKPQQGQQQGLAGVQGQPPQQGFFWALL